MTYFKIKMRRCFPSISTQGHVHVVAKKDVFFTMYVVPYYGQRLIRSIYCGSGLWISLTWLWRPGFSLEPFCATLNKSAYFKIGQQRLENIACEAQNCVYLACFFSKNIICLCKNINFVLEKAKNYLVRTGPWVVHP